MKKDLLEHWKKEEAAAFSGWDFSHIDGRWEEETLPWNYRKIVEKYLEKTEALLDMGTGGGEFLLSLGHPNELTSVTEGYAPNYELCKKKLGSLGIEVRFAGEDNRLDFDDNSFDLVINRHEAYDPSEVKRVLKDGGIFITQQVGVMNNAELSEKLIGERKNEFEKWDLKHSVKALEEQEFELIMKDECYPKLKFFDIVALVYFAKVIEWEFSGFSVEKCLDELMRLHGECERKGFAESTEHRFVVVGRKE